MSDYTNSKAPTGAIYPIDALASSWDYLEPLITPESLRINFLFGLPLISFKNPLTNEFAEIKDEDLKQIIIRAVSLAETELQVQIMPIQVTERHAYDQRLYQAFGYFRTNYRPVSSIEDLTIRTSNGDDIFRLPAEWIETGNLPVGQINIVPLYPAFTNSATSTAPAGAVFLSLLKNAYWIPAFWNITYTAGFKDGQLPRIINELIGTIAAMEVLSMLAATAARTNGMSLSIDGLSQSFSTPGPQLYKIRIDELKDKKEMIVRKIRKMFIGFVVSNQ